jgi:hypothetical protein
MRPLATRFPFPSRVDLALEVAYFAGEADGLCRVAVGGRELEVAEGAEAGA